MKIHNIIFYITIAFSLFSCDDKFDTGIDFITPNLNVIMPDEFENATITGEEFEIKNVSTGRTIIFTSKADISLPLGLYDIGYEADVVADGNAAHVTGFRQSVEINSTNQPIDINAFETIVNDDFIIEEVFFTGTLQSSGNTYNGDDYIKIHNNTDHTLYADGLSIVETKLTTTQKLELTPDIMDEAMTVHAIYTIPGSGKDYPVQPGESLLICDTGIDHRIANPNSFDLSNADFEWYDVSSSPSHLDIDGPNVPNLDKWYCYTLSFFMLHNRGFKAWALARIPIDKEQYLANYLYQYNYTMVLPAGTFPMSQTAYRLPNAWIVDAVNCSVASEYAWNVTSPTLDKGWAYCGDIDKDKTRYFHSVRRKMLYLKDGKPVLKDTNNSSADFNSNVIASEIELQGTAIDFNGTKSTGITWDGVTPRSQE